VLTSRSDSLSITFQEARGLLFEGTTQLILVHGAMDRAKSFSRMTRSLVDFGFDTKSYDRRGYEESALVDPYSQQNPPTIEDHILDLASVIGEQKSLIFGHSLGGTIALLLSARNISPIAGIVTFESPLPWMEFWRRSGAYGIDPDKPLDLDFCEEFAEIFMKRMLGEERWMRLPPSTRKKRRLEGSVLVAEMASMSHLTPPLDPSLIKVPTIIGCGINAPSRHKEATAYLASNIAGAKAVEIADTDHGVHLTNPTAAVDLIKGLWQFTKD
ncbi:unnamed protein product, partial [Acidithrix sp. C25]